MSTNCPSFNCGPLHPCHLERSCNVLRYSALYLCQKCCCICRISCYLLKRLIFISRKSCSGKAFRSPPTRKCSGLKKFRSFGSELSAINGLDRQIWLYKPWWISRSGAFLHAAIKNPRSQCRNALTNACPGGKRI
ncbi:hypothetical protein PUN28_002117 [Cardiocondyla obscurior]|uniref:Uncharacterized protein n=1 Tax=Cardiocondyla obscurior TaxID=286306 RepID=A0AAW2GSQ4_9HYME